MASTWESAASVGVGGASDLTMEGDRRCLCRYEAEDMDRGGCGLIVDGDRGTSSWWYDEVRLTEGLLVLDDAGD